MNWQPQVDYAKLKYFPVGSSAAPARQGECMSRDDMRFLLSGRVIVEEKMDGAPRSFSAGGKYLVFAEDLRHTGLVRYRIPGRYAVFDIFDYEKRVFLDYGDKAEITNDIRKGLFRMDGLKPGEFFQVPPVNSGTFTDINEIILLMGNSAYAADFSTPRSALMEGLVVKPDRELFQEEQLRGQIVRREFMASSGLIIQNGENLIDPRVGVVMCHDIAEKVRDISRLLYS